MFCFREKAICWSFQAEAVGHEAQGSHEASLEGAFPADGRPALSGAWFPVSWPECGRWTHRAGLFPSRVGTEDKNACFALYSIY